MPQKEKKKVALAWEGLEIEWSPHFKSSFLYPRTGSYRRRSCHPRESCSPLVQNAGWEWLITAGL